MTKTTKLCRDCEHVKEKRVRKWCDCFTEKKGDVWHHVHWLEAPDDPHVACPNWKKKEKKPSR